MDKKRNSTNLSVKQNLELIKNLDSEVTVTESVRNTDIQQYWTSPAPISPLSKKDTLLSSHILVTAYKYRLESRWAQELTWNLTRSSQLNVRVLSGNQTSAFWWSTYPLTIPPWPPLPGAWFWFNRETLPRQGSVAILSSPHSWILYIAPLPRSLVHAVKTGAKTHTKQTRVQDLIVLLVVTGNRYVRRWLSSYLVLLLTAWRKAAP
jgi:hypothetical protein